MEKAALKEKQIREAFAVLDVDGSGALDMEEFRQVLTTEGDTQLSPAQAQAMFDAVHSNGNGLIEPDAFVAWWMRKLLQQDALAQNDNPLPMPIVAGACTFVRDPSLLEL